jgi:hypothetical protein
VSLKGRIRGLDARVEWLQDWGKLRKLAQQMRYLAAKKKIVDRAPELAVSLGLMPAPKPTPPPALPPKRESFPREDPRPSGIPRANSVQRPDSHATPPAAECATETSQGEAASAPGDASAHDAPPGGIVPRPPRASPAPPDQPIGQPLVQPFVPFQNGLIRWRQRGPEDDWEDDEPLEDEDYDPLAAES